jgi:hypothetical protein
MAEARDATGSTLVSMQRLGDFEDGRDGLLEFFFIPADSLMLSAIFVDGFAVAFSSDVPSERDLLGHVRQLEPSPQQLAALEQVQALDAGLIGRALTGGKVMLDHIRKQYLRMQNGIYRPAVSQLICAPGADWQMALHHLDEWGLVSVTETYDLLLDLAGFSLGASRPRKPAELAAEFAAEESDYTALMQEIARIRADFGLELTFITTEDEMVSVV